MYPEDSVLEDEAMNRFINVLAVLMIASSHGAAGNNSIAVRLSINTFKSTHNDRAMVEKMTSVLYRELVRLLGEEYVVYKNTVGLGRSANRQVTGSVEKIDETYFITIKVLDGEKGEQLFNKTCTADSGDIEKTMRDIAKQIHKDRRVWQR